MGKKFAPPLWHVWNSMIRRCENPGIPNYRNYGGRGIKVCDRWRNSFEQFVSDMGPRPSDMHSIDRIDNDGNYEPSNCRWATRAVQNVNKRNNRRITIDGRTMTTSQWAKEKKISMNVLANRLSRGWPEVEAVTRPVRKNRLYAL